MGERPIKKCQKIENHVLFFNGILGENASFIEVRRKSKIFKIVIDGT